MKPVITFVGIEDQWERDYFKSTLENIAEVKYFKETVDLVIDKIKDTKVLSTFISSKVTKDVIDAMPELKLIATRSTGFDHIDVEYATSKGIFVSNVPTYGENTVAEHTFALILSLARNLKKAHMKANEGDYSINDLMGFDLKDKTIGIIGTGHIGLRVIQIAAGFGMKILAFSRTPNHFLSEVLGYKIVDLETLLKESDIISLHAPYNKKTHNMINEKNIELIKKGAVLINTSRGGLVDLVALTKALDKKILSGAALDVLEEEGVIMEDRQLLMRRKKDLQTPERLKSILRSGLLIQRQNVIFTPHIGFYSKEALQRILDTTIYNINNFLNDTPSNSVC